METGDARGPIGDQDGTGDAAITRTDRRVPALRQLTTLSPNSSRSSRLSMAVVQPAVHAVSTAEFSKCPTEGNLQRGKPVLRPVR
jgi:hypothetical protein